jgi:hypothetical protein
MWNERRSPYQGQSECQLTHIGTGRPRLHTRVFTESALVASRFSTVDFRAMNSSGGSEVPFCVPGGSSPARTTPVLG